MTKHMADFMIEIYGEEVLKKMSLRDILEIAWYFYHNPINEWKIKGIFMKNNLDSYYKEIPI